MLIMLIIVLWVIPFVIFWVLNILQMSLERKIFNQTWKEYLIDMTILDALIWVALTIMSLTPIVAWVPLIIILSLADFTIFPKFRELFNVKLSDLGKKND